MDIADMPSVWGSSRAFFNLRHAALQPYSSRRTTLTLAHRLYDDAEDRVAVIEVVNYIGASGGTVCKAMKLELKL